VASEKPTGRAVDCMHSMHRGWLGCGISQYTNKHNKQVFEQAQDMDKCAWLCSFSAILNVAILIIKFEFGVFEL
jgi:hypothetical protein